MKILLNTATINQGGAVQVAINLIQYTFSDPNHEYYYVVPKIIYDSTLLTFQGKNVLIIETTPAKPILGRSTRAKIKQYEKVVRPDVVYSVGSPSYISFKTREVLRMTNALIFNSHSIAMTTYTLRERILFSIKTRIQRWFIKDRHFIITQTQDAKEKISKNLGIQPKQIFVIPNVVAPQFRTHRCIKAKNDVPNILVFAAPYPHKNLSIVPLVALALKKLNVEKFKFILTYSKGITDHEIIKLERRIEQNNLENHFTNVGRVPYEECINLYNRSDILFLPTLLETFSVTLLEAMAMKVPIVTTDFEFNREVCDNSALYFKPANSLDAASKLAELIRNPELQERLTKDALARLDMFPTHDQVYRMHIEALEKINEQ